MLALEVKDADAIATWIKRANGAHGLGLALAVDLGDDLGLLANRVPWRGLVLEANLRVVPSDPLVAVTGQSGTFGPPAAFDRELPWLGLLGLGGEVIVFGLHRHNEGGEKQRPAPSEFGNDGTEKNDETHADPILGPERTDGAAQPRR